MDLRTRVTLLSESGDRDWTPTAPLRPGDAPTRLGGSQSRPGDPIGITSVRHPGHGVTQLMRVMQTNACSLSCGYCPTFCGGRVRRTYLEPEEVTRVFMDTHRRGLADGLFLTSGAPGRPSRMTDRMLATLDLRRRREGFRGYIHLKLFPVPSPRRWSRRCGWPAACRSTSKRPATGTCGRSRREGLRGRPAAEAGAGRTPRPRATPKRSGRFRGRGPDDPVRRRRGG